jgi:hypothetical protein
MIFEALAKGAMRVLGCLGVGRAAGPSAVTDILFSYNALLSTWRTERLMVYSVGRDVYPAEASKANYRIGPGGDFDTARPVRIENAGWMPPGSDQEYPIEVVTDTDRWAAVRNKGRGGTPCALYHERTVPLAELRPWPIPQEAGRLVLYPWRPLTAVATVEEDIEFPDGYDRASLLNLALEIAPMFREATVTPLLVQQAAEAKAAIKRLNLVTPIMSCDSAVLGSGVFDILSGDYL